MVKLQHGEYISLGKIESELKTCPIIDNVCIYADSTKIFAVALLTPNPDQLKAVADKSKFKMTNVCSAIQVDFKNWFFLVLSCKLWDNSKY